MFSRNIECPSLNKVYDGFSYITRRRNLQWKLMHQAKIFIYLFKETSCWHLYRWKNRLWKTTQIHSVRECDSSNSSPPPYISPRVNAHSFHLPQCIWMLVWHNFVSFKEEPLLPPFTHLECAEERIILLQCKESLGL